MSKARRRCTCAKVVCSFGALALAAAAGTALAAPPTKNGLYDGTLTGKGLTKKLEVHVSPNGKKATAALNCEGALSGKIPAFPIKRGKFKGHDRGNHFGVRGRFTTPTSAAVTLHLYGICDIAAPSNYKLTLTLSPS